MNIRNGGNIWREWLHVTGNTPSKTLICIDKHRAVDDFSVDEAVDVGAEFDHMDEICAFICSFSKPRGRGLAHRTNTFEEEAPWDQFIQQIGGVVFTDRPVSHDRYVEIYRSEWMGPRVIGFNGDKGQVAALMTRPTLIFDDKKENITLVRKRGVESDGILVKRPNLRSNVSQESDFRCEADPYRWIPIIQDFCDQSAGRGYGVRPAQRTASPTQLTPRLLPTGWHSVWSDEHDEFYFWNPRTGEVTWDLGWRQERSFSREPGRSCFTIPRSRGHHQR